MGLLNYLSPFVCALGRTTPGIVARINTLEPGNSKETV